MKDICIKTFSNRIQAEIAKNLFASNNIESYIKNGDLGGAYPVPFSASSGVKLYVKKSQRIKAKKLLNNT